MPTKGIPTYSLEQFKSSPESGLTYQIEVFDVNRHFEVEYPHRHDFFEILFLTKGSGIHVIDDKEYQIHPPCVFFLSPGQAHKLELSKDVSGYIFLFTAEFYLVDRTNKHRLLEFPFFFNLNQENPPLQLKDEQSVQFIAELFKRGIALKKDGSNAAHASALLDLLLHTFQPLYPVDDVQVKGKGHLMVKRFRELIEDNYQFNLSVKDYAEKLNITENHLTHTVKNLTGKTSKELITDKQIIEIKRLLKHSDLTISEIANQLGFADQSYFSKFLIKHTGSSPSEIRSKSLKST